MFSDANENECVGDPITLPGRPEVAVAQLSGPPQERSASPSWGGEEVSAPVSECFLCLAEASESPPPPLLILSRTQFPWTATSRPAVKMKPDSKGWGLAQCWGPCLPVSQLFSTTPTQRCDPLTQVLMLCGKYFTNKDGDPSPLPLMPQPSAFLHSITDRSTLFSDSRLRCSIPSCVRQTPFDSASG